MTAEMDLENMSEGAKWFINRPSIRMLRRVALDDSVVRRGIA